jgi:hypothetical protein
MDDQHFEEIIREWRRRADAALDAARQLTVRRALSQALRETESAPFGPVLALEDLARYLRTPGDLLQPYLDQIPHFELAGRLLFRKEAVDEWIRERERRLAVETLESDVRHMISEGVPDSFE